MVRAYRHLTLLSSLSLRRDDGQTLVEYALILAILSLGLVAALSLLRDEIGDLFTTIMDAV
jgi:Flp pilus assembly pilin Flp